MNYGGLKALIKSLNETIRPSPGLRIGGNKSDLIQRLVQLITEYHNIGDQVVIRQIRHCVAAFNQGEVSTIATPAVSLHHPHNSGGSGSTIGASGGYRIQTPGSSTMLTSKSTTGHPFYKDTQTLTAPKLCIEAKDRTLSVTLPLNIPPMLAMQLKKDPEYQLMVFCGWADGPTSSPVLMEFPHVCEIKVNGRVLEANLRGMKNKPGTVSPANITKLCRLEAADYNKVEFIYANSTKRYFASTHLVKKISVESIVAEIERGKFLSKEKMLRLIEDRNKDEDIMATSSTLSLKCPLGFQRITVPCRSSYCQHLQCFDAYTFFNLNEQTPTWTCPVCSRTMHSWEEIVVDGYFKDILSSTPKSLESITVQADGTWELPSSTAQTDQAVAPSPKKKAAPAGDSVFVIDEDDSDAEEESPAAPSTPVKPTKPVIEVIDLISDSEDETEEPSVRERTAIDKDGDSSMQEAANSLQNMAQSSVKTEVLDKSVPVEDNNGDVIPPPLSAGVAAVVAAIAPTTAEATVAIASAPEIHSVVGSASGSPPTASSSASPEIPIRMIQANVPTGALSPLSRAPQTAWGEDNEDMFMNVPMNPRRKRQFDGTLSIYPR
ncbi:SUMO ligase siz1 [Mortierella sp. GBA30]|nr:SUMO ligase siz1 [Mortierella sp. GBA30]